MNQYNKVPAGAAVAFEVTIADRNPNSEPRMHGAVTAELMRNAWGRDSR